MLKLIFFGPLGELSLGKRSEIEWSEQVNTVTKLVESFSEHQQLVDSIYNPGVQIAINRVMGDWDSILNNGDEVAFLPPVSGG